MSDSFDDLETKLNKVKDARLTEQAIDHCQRGILNAGIIYKIAAESDYGTSRGGAERSINVTFTVEESAAIFGAAAKVLGVRLKALKAELGL